MSGLRLLWRVLRGGGAAGLLRQLLMIAGICVGVLVLAFIASMPGTLDERAATSSARMPLSTAGRADANTNANTNTDADGRKFSYSLVQSSWGGQRFTRVLIADAAPDSPLPPGLSRLPKPGEAILSPAAERAAADRAFAALVPGRRIGQVRPAGLLGPDDLYAYIGVTSDRLGDRAEARGWGGLSADVAVRDRFSLVPYELALIVVAPGVIYLNVCARLSAATRRRRYAALRLVGMDPRRVLRLAAGESAVAGALGTLSGLALYGVVNRWVGPSGVIGFSWYAASSRLTVPLAVAAFVLVTVASGAIGAKNTAKALARPVEARFDGADRRAGWWHALPFALGIGLIGFPVVSDALADGPPRGPASGTQGVLLIAGILLASVGVLFAVRPLLGAAARWIGGGRGPLAVRLAARRVEHESAGLTWHLSGLVLLVLVACVGAGVLHQNEVASSLRTGPMTVGVEAREAAPADRAGLWKLPADHRWAWQSSVHPQEAPATEPQTAQDWVRAFGATVVTADCATVREQTGRPLPECADGHVYRIAQQGELTLPQGLELKFRTGTGAEAEDKSSALTTLKASGPTLDLGRAAAFVSGPALLSTGPVPALGITEDTRIQFRIDGSLAAADEFASALAKVAPAATARAGDLDLDGLEDYRVHRGTIDSGVWIAFLLGASAFLISAIGRASERRRDVTALVVLGVPVRTLRAVQWLQLLAPLSLVLALALLTGALAGNAVLLLQGASAGWYGGTLTAAGPAVLIAVLSAAVVGAFVTGLRPRPEDLHRA
ncbi:FtsX-like permease family protein [Streptomyces sp. NBC_01465]|uniref:FtsX-like permease family protein n=1 Tax=Streptomyces sp. NBC_01465 TaxID=2903878 RepID=UPI002E36D590|nr:FtsX-like permease family protein [Streptomyces sp. NBC_01465]